MIGKTAAPWVEENIRVSKYQESPKYILLLIRTGIRVRYRQKHKKTKEQKDKRQKKDNMTKKQKDKKIKCVKRKQNKKIKRELSIVMSGQFCTLAIFLSWILQHIMSKGGRQCQGHFTPLSLSCRGDCIGVYVFFWSLKRHFLTFRKS